METASEGIIGMDVEGYVTYVNGSLLHMLGYNFEEMLSRHIKEFIYPEDYADYDRQIACRSNGLPGYYDLRYKKKDGGPLWCMVSTSPVMGVDGTYEGSFAMLTNITERKLAEEALVKSEKLYANAIAATSDGIWEWDLTTDVTYYSPRWYEMLGYEVNAFPMNLEAWKSLCHPDDLEASIAAIQVCLASAESLSFMIEFRMRAKSGAWRWIRGRGNVVDRDAQGKPRKVAGTNADITERKLAERALQESEERYKRLADNAQDAIFLADDSGNILDANRHARETLGYSREEFTHMRVWDIDLSATPESYSRLIATCLAQGVVTVFGSHRRADGTEYPVEVQTCVFQEQGSNFILGVARDVTDRMKMQELMIQTEKMMSVGGLAAGMAHEINNPLSGILQSLQVIKRRLKEPSALSERAASESGCTFESIQIFLAARKIFNFLDAIEESGRRASQIVRSMLSFSRCDSSGHQPVEIKSLLDKSLELCATDYDLKSNYDFRNIKIIKNYDSRSPSVMGLATQIQQVLMNILTNAAHAMVGSREPCLVLSTRLEDGMVQIDIKDNGPGMADELRRKVFEPFFTTKEVGSGTGLGFSVSYFIVVNHHRGTIEVESESGKGAHFIIRLPSALDREAPRAPLAQR